MIKQFNYYLPRQPFLFRFGTLVILMNVASKLLNFLKLRIQKVWSFQLRAYKKMKHVKMLKLIILE